MTDFVKFISQEFMTKILNDYVDEIEKNKNIKNDNCIKSENIIKFINIFKKYFFNVFYINICYIINIKSINIKYLLEPKTSINFIN